MREQDYNEQDTRRDELQVSWARALFIGRPRPVSTNSDCAAALWSAVKRLVMLENKAGGKEAWADASTLIQHARRTK